MLDDYAKKRDFARTPEPRAQTQSAADGALTFVIHKHDARRLHYDFRLELDGALKSWAVPKGPSLDPADKRLAVMVEDHPLGYGSFEGVIPRGEYGAGQVIVWDNGTYVPEEEDKPWLGERAEAEERLRKALAKGKLSFFLRGRKLKGGWTLVRTSRSPKDWLLIKRDDDLADPGRDVTRDDRSVISGLSLEDLKAGRLPDEAVDGQLAGHPGQLAGAVRAPFPRSAAPMLPSLTDRPFSRPEWLYEPKLDGVRAIALIRDAKVRLVSRRGLDPTRQYPSLTESLARQPEREMVVDGEIVALDEQGRPSFHRLQQRLNLTRAEDIRRAEAQVPVIYYAFDLLYLDGFDLRGAALAGRKSLLERILVPSARVQLLEPIDADGIVAYDAAVEHGLEGVVAKRRDSPYQEGRRSSYWLKVKATLSDDFVVGGFSQGMGARADTFGALLLGYYDDRGQLAYAGHVGSGFDDRTLQELRRRLESMRTKECPFASLEGSEASANGGRARWGRPIGGVTWVKPELVVEVKYDQWTPDGRLRAPVFLRVRDDKPPAEASRRQPVPSRRVAARHTVPSREADDGVASQAAELEDVLKQLEDPRQKLVLAVEGHRISLTNLDKELWPALGSRRPLTKRDLLAYLARVAPYYVAHLRDRPLSLVRYPDGIHGERFFQKHWPHRLPDFVDTVRLFSQQGEGDGEYMLCNNLATLLWLGQAAALELHSWFSRISPDPDGRHLSTEFAGSAENMRRSLLNYPDFIIFDLDPYIYSGQEARGAEPELNRKAFAKTCEIALRLKELLDGLSLSSFAKTSGRTGLHIFVPIVRQFNYDAVRSMSETIGRFLLRERPRDVTMEWSVQKRTGKVFVDHNQNIRGKTVASVYSPRASAEATVSMPLSWDEVGKVFPTDFTILNTPQRLQTEGDLWAGILDAKRDLQGLMEAMQR